MLPYEQMWGTDNEERKFCALSQTRPTKAIHQVTVTPIHAPLVVGGSRKSCRSASRHSKTTMQTTSTFDTDRYIMDKDLRAYLLPLPPN